MSPEQTAQLRALARWHTSRRAVDDLLTPLLEYGPIAVDRVSDQLSQVQQLLREEHAAFAAFTSLVADRTRESAVVVELFSRLSTVDAD